MPDTLAALVAGQCLATIGRLRPAWHWLTTTIEPGRTRPQPRYLSDTERQRLDALIRRERRDRSTGVRRTPGWWPAGHGLGNAAVKTPIGASAAPVRIGAISAAGAVHRLVVDVAQLVAVSLDAVYLQPPRDPVPSTLDWLTTTALDHVDDHDAAQRALVLLDRADELARLASGCPDDIRVPVDAPCPACERRSLYVEARSERQEEWSIRCGATWCQCRGGPCGCKRPITVAGWRHVWPRREWGALERALPRRPVRGSAA